MTWRKRLFDLFFASLLVVILGPILLLLLLWLLVREGRPVFYVAERMRSPTRSFRLWKLRTMTVVDADSGVSGGDKEARITRTGAWLRSKQSSAYHLPSAESSATHCSPDALASSPLAQLW